MLTFSGEQYIRVLFMNSQILFLSIFSLKIDPTVLFIYLKIILLQ